LKGNIVLEMERIHLQVEVGRVVVEVEIEIEIGVEIG
jgi:hypothetical protein